MTSLETAIDEEVEKQFKQMDVAHLDDPDVPTGVDAPTDFYVGVVAENVHRDRKWRGYEHEIDALDNDELDHLVTERVESLRHQHR